MQKIHIVLLAEKECQDQLEKLSQSVDSGDNSIVLGADVIPHITLYNPTIPPRNIDSVYPKLERIAARYIPFVAGFDNYAKPPQGDDGLFVNYHAKGPVVDLREDVIKEITLLRDGHIEDRYKDLAGDDSKLKRFARHKVHHWLSSWYEDATAKHSEVAMYGYPISYYHFPHVTLAKFNSSEKRNTALEQLQGQLVQDFRVRSIAVVETGEHGTAKRIIREFPLKEKEG